MKIAIIGTGISGLTAAHLLHRRHDLTIFEAGTYPGGHSHTVDVVQDGESFAIDTGFMVYNPANYPNFIKVLKSIGVMGRPTQMSFSVHNAQNGLEYCGSNLNTIFAQRRNLIRAGFYRLLMDVFRFNRLGKQMLRMGVSPRLSLGQLLDIERFSTIFQENYLLPMGGAIWSASTGAMRSFPAGHFLRFFENHGLLSVSSQPQWHTIQGGSRQYVRSLIKPFAHRIRLNTPVRSIQRDEKGAWIRTVDGEAEHYDRVVIATHSNQALHMLADPTPQEQTILAAITYQPNEVVLHTDRQLLPRSRRAWAAWNYHIADEPGERATVTYNMNILQGLQSRAPFCVTLNQTGLIDEAKVLGRYVYDHPVFNEAAFAAQARKAEISNHQRNTFYCGAYWGYGFHEDGVNSGLDVAAAFGEVL